MRLYGKRFAKSMVDKRVRSSVEGRDCIIWEVNKYEKFCRVRIQGSSTYIHAKFPQNVKMIPEWIRVGNSVKISHRSGVRGHVYITGQGTSTPSMITGDNTPDSGISANGVITGMVTTITDPLSMDILISDGTYRINDITYEFGVSSFPMYYDDPPVVMYDSEPVITYNELRITLNDPPSVTYFRYDLFVVGEDGVLDYIPGATSKTPVKPDIPTGHIQVGDYILIIGGRTVVSIKEIGLEWYPIEATTIRLFIEGDELSHDMTDVNMPDPDDNPEYLYIDIVFAVYDQYDNALAGNYTLKLDKVVGLGDLWSSQSGYADSVQQSISGSSYTFVLRRSNPWGAGNAMGFQASTTINGREFKLAAVVNYME